MLGTLDAGRSVEYALWDLAAKRLHLPVYALAASINHRPVPDALRVPCYDTSLYMDDLHLSNSHAAAAMIANEARAGHDAGHRAFKIKIGRGAMHMPPEAGTQRDITVTRAVRAAVGDSSTLMLDANNGCTLNIAKRILAETAECSIFWLEEAFHEDAAFYGALKAWLAEQRLPCLVADGEGDASPNLLAWAREGLIDVVQYDIFGYGFSRWLALGRVLDGAHVKSAPHHYGAHLGNYIGCHLCPAIAGFTYAEWDDVQTPGIDASAYRIRDGLVEVPNAPGFGLHLDEAAFVRAVRETGGSR